MVDKDLILAKAGSIQRHCSRIVDKSNVTLNVFKDDLDRQDVVLFNMQMAIQNCIDIAAHIVSEEGYGVPGSANEMFYLIEENKIIKRELTERIVKAVGLRNLIVHEYGKINLDQIYNAAKNDIGDLSEFVKCILSTVP
jgi:uncharacterized protein YutE (UPF0331/DUF86 family)